VLVRPPDRAVLALDAAVGHHVDLDPLDEERVGAAAALLELVRQALEVSPGTHRGSDVDAARGPLRGASHQPDRQDGARRRTYHQVLDPRLTGDSVDARQHLRGEDQLRFGRVA
jgi:hypothetical protein